MRVYPTFLRSSLPFALALAALVFAPAAGAQTLVPRVGDAIPFSVSLPQGWEMEEEDEMLYVHSEDEDFIIMTAATDLLAEEEESPELPEAEMRRIMTAMMMSSDSLLLQLLEMGFMNQADMQVSDVVKEIRTLGGERAAYMGGRLEVEGEQGWMQVQVTVKDGIMYILGFIGKGDSPGQWEPLMARIRESYVLADASAM